MLLIIKKKKDYGINNISNFNVISVIILSTVAILFLYLSNTFLFDVVNQIWADSVIDVISVGTSPWDVAYDSGMDDLHVSNNGYNTVSVTTTAPSQPIANAGSDQQIRPYKTVNLDGSASYDPNGFTPLTYNWTQTSGPSVSLSNPSSSYLSFKTPFVNGVTNITFQLIVTNNKGVQSNPSYITITIEPLSAGDNGNNVSENGNIRYNDNSGNSGPSNTGNNDGNNNYGNNDNNEGGNSINSGINSNNGNIVGNGYNNNVGNTGYGNGNGNSGHTGSGNSP